MDIRDFNKIVIVSLCDSFSKSLGNLLSQNLGMIFCDTKDLVEYELIDKQLLESFCSKEYLEKAEKTVLKHISSFENVVVSINYDYLRHNLNILKAKSLIVFLKFSKNFVKENGSAVDIISYEERTEELQKTATLTINVQKTDLNFVCQKVVQQLGGLI